jgi:hypothetical protein
MDEVKPYPGQQWKCGDEFLPFHPQASHVPADYRDGWNRCYRSALAAVQAERERAAQIALAERVDAKATGDASDAAYNLACEHIAAAIRSGIDPAQA